MKPFVIGDSQTVLGFRLAGVEGRVATEREDVLAALGAGGGLPVEKNNLERGCAFGRGAQRFGFHQH